MKLIEAITLGAERLPFPDWALRLGVYALVSRTSRLFRASPMGDEVFVRTMERFPIAQHVEEANQQHYELPAAFFELVLGPRRKYSSCLYPGPFTTLAEAEEAALAETVAHADLRDGQTVLELGCGWGSLTLFMARRFPASSIVAVSNSRPQKAYIEAQARRHQIRNVTVITADMNHFDPGRRFDRIVSVEMFEHMANWRALMRRVRNWLEPDGRLFLHVFTHATHSYRFDLSDRSDWIARHFFTGGIMPSHALVDQFADCFGVEQEWRWSGIHYQRTARDWLGNFDRDAGSIRVIFDDVYGSDAPLWMRRWRLFFLATAGLFGYAQGSEWYVSHYRMKPASEGVAGVHMALESSDPS